MDKKIKYILIAILLVSAVLRVGWLSRGDTVSDEVLLAFRSLGMIDFDEAETQTTPWEWHDPNIPSWAKISFHDHPPLVFWTQHFSMKIFGESNFGFRLPSALFGIASVFLIFLLGKKLFSEKIGLLAAALLAVTLNNIYVSRIGIMESYLIFFMLLSAYFFLKALEKDKYFLWMGVALGLGALTKYNIVIMVPIFFTYLLIFKRNYLLNRNLLFGLLLSLLIFSPVIYYNIMLYKTAGHFDFQFSYIFGQNPAEWQVMPGKEIGSLSERFADFIPRQIRSNSWLFLSFFAAAAIAFFIPLFKNFKKTLNKYAFLLISLFYITALLIVFIGPSYRFSTMLAPFLALGVAIFLNSIYEKFLRGREKLAFSALALILFFEMAYSVNNEIFYYPKGPLPWVASWIRYSENYSWGYNELADFLEKETEGKIPALTFDLRYKFLEKLRDEALEKGRRDGALLYPALFIFEGNFDRGARLWVLDRLHVYHAWPIISAETYFDYLRQNGSDYYDKAGFKNYYFILQTNIVPWDALKPLMKGTPEIVHNKRGEEVFEIYKF